MPKLFSILFTFLLVSCTQSQETVPEYQEDVKPDIEIQQEPSDEVEIQNTSSLIPWEDDSLFAIIQLSSDYQQTDFSSEIKRCLAYYLPDVIENELPQFILEGYETFMLIARYPDNKLCLYDYIFNGEDLEKSHLLEEISGVEAFILRCNVSDLFANNLFIAEVNGEELEFSVSTSLRDGSVSESPYLTELNLPD